MNSVLIRKRRRKRVDDVKIRRFIGWKSEKSNLLVDCVIRIKEILLNYTTAFAQESSRQLIFSYTKWVHKIWWRRKERRNGKVLSGKISIL